MTEAGSMEFSLQQVRQFLSAHKRAEIHDPALVPAAVLMVFFEKAGAWHLLMTKRSEVVEHHKGQISFPGGAKDAGDRDLSETALREAREEIGLPGEEVEILGFFDDHATPTGFVITPVVAYARRLPPLKPQNAEVMKILEVPVRLFLDGRSERVVPMMRLGKTIDVFFYAFGEDEIWGATARISRDFLRAIVGEEYKRL